MDIFDKKQLSCFCGLKKVEIVEQFLGELSCQN